MAASRGQCELQHEQAEQEWQATITETAAPNTILHMFALQLYVPELCEFNGTYFQVINVHRAAAFLGQTYVCLYPELELTKTRECVKNCSLRSKLH